MTPLQELTKKIQAHCPELVELSIGVKVKTGNTFPATHTIRTYTGQRIIEDDRYDGHTGKWMVLCEEPLTTCSIVEIIGHDITLEHVLKAIAKSTLEYIRVTATQTESIGMIVAIDIGSGREFWNLGLPLHLQSEPIINWLNTIIK